MSTCKICTVSVVVFFATTEEMTEGGMMNNPNQTATALEDLLRLTKEIIAKKEETYERLEPNSLDEIEDRESFALSYAERIRAFESRVREHNYLYTCRLILERYREGFYYDDEQLELLFMLIDGQRIRKEKQ